MVTCHRGPFFCSTPSLCLIIKSLCAAAAAAAAALLLAAASLLPRFNAAAAAAATAAVAAAAAECMHVFMQPLHSSPLPYPTSHHYTLQSMPHATAPRQPPPVCAPPLAHFPLLRVPSPLSPSNIYLTPASHDRFAPLRLPRSAATRPSSNCCRQRTS